MPFKDDDKRREYQKDWIAKKRKRARDGATKKTYEIKIGRFTGVFTIHSGGVLTPTEKEELQKFESLCQKINAMNDQGRFGDGKAAVSDIIQVLKALETKKTFLNSCKDVVHNLLSIGCDLKLLHSAGGTSV